MTLSHQPTPVGRRAVFIDRDGTLNVHAGYIREPSQLVVYGYAGAALRKLNEAGWLTVLVTNQAIIGRGECTPATMDLIHARLLQSLAAAGARLDAIYVCPHRPARELTGTLAGLACDCRKPRPGMLLRAARDLDIDLARSWMIGDSATDIEAGIAAGTRTILLKTGVAGSDCAGGGSADLIAADFAAAAGQILASPIRARPNA